MWPRNASLTRLLSSAKAYVRVVLPSPVLGTTPGALAFVRTQPVCECGGLALACANFGRWALVVDAARLGCIHPQLARDGALVGRALPRHADRLARPCVQQHAFCTGRRFARHGAGPAGIDDATANLAASGGGSFSRCHLGSALVVEPPGSTRPRSGGLQPRVVAALGRGALVVSFVGQTDFTQPLVGLAVCQSHATRNVCRQNFEQHRLALGSRGCGLLQAVDAIPLACARRVANDVAPRLGVPAPATGRVEKPGVDLGC